MSQQTTIQIRIDAKTKREARKTLEEMGLDLSSGVKLFLHNVAITHSVPLELRTVNGFTLAEERRMIKETEEAMKTGPFFTNGEELLDSILK